MNGTEQFQKNKSINIAERTNRIIDVNTGEIIREESEIIKTQQKEPDFIKIYFNTIMHFNGIKNISADFLILICNYITYANNKKEQMRCVLNKMARDEISKELKVTSSMIDKNIKKCIDAGILFKTDYRATYIVNPFLIARGEWKNIKSLQTEFDYINGTWKYIKQFKQDQEK